MTNSEKIREIYDLPNKNSFGFSAAEISALEDRLGITLPKELKNYYLTFGKNKSINQAHNRLLSPAKEVGFSKDRYLLFFEENQSVAVWGIKEEDLKLPDPPVWANYGTAEEPDWYEETNTTSDFFLLMAVYNGTLGGLQYHANCFADVEVKVVKFIEDAWTLVAEISHAKQKVYTDNFKELISMSFDENGSCTAIFIGTTDQDRFDRILAEVEVDWSYISYEDEE